MAVLAFVRNTDPMRGINSHASDRDFCRNCQRYARCTRDFQKILDCNKMILEEYNNPQDLRESPLWYSELWKVADNIINDERERKLKAGKNGR